jgi:hypothetical protein
MQETEFRKGRGREDGDFLMVGSLSKLSAMAKRSVWSLSMQSFWEARRASLLDEVDQVLVEQK